ncbi:MAG: hypothetical protein ACNS60_19950 [Candidatus Cyclobacteriaceae bacterium M2_1C_046]
MKILIIILFALGLTVATKPAYVEKMDIQENIVKVEFDESMKFNDLVAIKLKLEARDIYITYEEMGFSKKGYLKELSYNVENKNENQKVILKKKVK